MIGRRYGFETLEARHLLAAQPLISEFMASNAGTLEDGDGATPDWIEIYNAGDQGVDLAGYRLTDDASDIAKWEFPNVLLNAGQYLTVFASGNGTPDSAGNLHTNFALSAGGEYLALVSPTGTVLTEYGSNAADYPPQTKDVSYGLAMETTLANPITPASSAKYLIPNDSSADGLWTDVGFDDTNWTAGTASIGYENTPADYEDLIDTAVPTGTTTVYLRIPFTVDNSDTSLNKLQLKYDDGFIAYLNGTRVASANAPADAGHNSVATDDHPDALAVEYVDFDLREHSGVLNVGTNVLAIHLMNRSPSSDLLAVPNLVLTSGGIIEPELIGYLASPTPGMPNTNLSASDVQFSRPAGVFSDNFLLTMTAAPGESIRYTTDGSNPDASSPLYTGSIAVDTTQQFRARTYGPAGQTGRLFSATYVKSSTAVTDFTSDLPIIVLDNRGGEVPDRDFQDSTFALYDIDPTTGRSSLSNPADVTSLSAQHRRGRSTFGQPKLNLRIELRDELGNDRSQSLLGLPAESDWVLYAPWTIDRAMVRHSLMYDLGRQAGSWAPRTRFVEVYSNYDGGDLSTNDYVGVYVLMEVIKRDAERVDIAELTPTQNTEPDVTGGYILQIDIPEPGDVSWDSERGYPLGGSQFIPVEPEGTELTPSQSDYIRNYIDDFEDALFGPNFTDPDLGYQAYLDAEAAIDFHLMNTFSANPDAFRLSTYLTKDRGEKLAFGPLWDFDRGMGPDEDDRAADPTQWMSDQAYLWVTQYWNRLFDDPNFEQRWVDRWQELRQTVFSDSNLQATLRGQTDQLAEAQARNAARWGAGIAPNGGPLSTEGGGWAGEVSHLENWLLARVAWIDTQMISQPTISPTPGNVASGTLVTLSADTGARIYYTLDGSDPCAVGGGISPSAMLYNETISVTETTQINARARGTGDFFGGWSGPIEGLYSFQQPADASNLRVTELHYHPSDPTAAELAVVPTASDNDFEFIELVNVGNETLNLGGVRFVDGIDFDFGSDALVSLGAGEALVLVANEAAFVARYGDNLLVAGEYSGSLSNGGELVGLIDASGQPIQSFIYSDDPPWPTGPDGDGPSLEIVNTSGDYSSASNWRASRVSQGTPGTHSVDVPGDYDRNGIVESADYNVWRTTFGSTIDLAADGNGDGLVNAADYTIWRDNLGSSTLIASATSTIDASRLLANTPTSRDSAQAAASWHPTRVYYPTQVRSNFNNPATRRIELQKVLASDRAMQQYLLIEPNEAPQNSLDDPNDAPLFGSDPTDPPPVELVVTHLQSLDACLAEFGNDGVR